MDFAVNVIGLLNSVWIINNKDRRKFFCVCDKISIGKNPQCALGAFSHLLSLGLILSSTSQYSFYPLSLWTFTLIFTGMFTYKGVREICKECAVAYITSILSTINAYSHLSSFPWIVSAIYLGIILTSLYLMSLGLKKTN